MSVVLDGNPKTPKALQDLARHQMILKLLQDIRIDMAVCEIEGWDKMEYINLLKDTINHFGNDIQNTTDIMVV